MARPLASMLSGKRGLRLFAGAMVVAALLPWTAWASYLNNPVLTVLAPAQQTVRSTWVWLRGPAPGVSDNKELEDMRIAVAEANAKYLRAQDDVETLRQQVRALADVQNLNPSSKENLIIAPVIGPAPDLSGGLLTIRAGSNDGVAIDSVVVVRGVHVVGRIKRVTDRTSDVLPITFRSRRAGGSAPMVRGVVMLEDSRVGPVCNLEPTGEGTLEGRVEDAGDPNSADQPSLVRGMTVRLNDDNWPAGSRMLIVGTITDIKPVPTSPLRKLITVTPMHTIERWNDVMIRVPGGANPSQTPASAPAQNGRKP